MTFLRSTAEAASKIAGMGATTRDLDQPAGTPGPLLPTYLTSRELPSVGDYVIDSWAAFAAALDDGEPVLDMLARRATELYRGAPVG